MGKYRDVQAHPKKPKAGIYEIFHLEYAGIDARAKVLIYLLENGLTTLEP